jgi:spermidine/putrescine transport system substrate-binding protein
MKPIKPILILAVLSCTSSALAAGELRIYTWGGYLKPEILTRFEKETGIKPKVDYYGSNEEMIAKLQAGGVSQYDIVVPSDFVVPSMIQLKLLTALDKKKIPNLKNLSKQFTNPPYDPGNTYTAGLYWFMVGLTYDKRKFKTAPDSWSVLLEPSKQMGKFLLMDSTREMMGAALKYKGLSVNSTDPQQVQAAGKLLLEAKNSNNSLGFAADVALRNRVIAGEAGISVGYSGDAIAAAAENKNLGFALPKEGGTVAIDSLAIPARAPNTENAYKFINFMYDAKNNAENTNFVHFATPNAAALPLINAADRKNPLIYPPAALLAKFEFIKDLGANNRLYDEVWTAIKSR